MVAVSDNICSAANVEPAMRQSCFDVMIRDFRFDPLEKVTLPGSNPRFHFILRDKDEGWMGG